MTRIGAKLCGLSSLVLKKISRIRVEKDQSFRPKEDNARTATQDGAETTETLVPLPFVASRQPHYLCQQSLGETLSFPPTHPVDDGAVFVGAWS
jgi:hypothetical protein